MNNVTCTPEHPKPPQVLQVDSATKRVIVDFTAGELELVADAAGDMKDVPTFVRDAAVAVAKDVLAEED